MSFLQRLAERGGISGNAGAASAKRAHGVLLPDTASRPWFGAMDRPANESTGDPMDVPRLRRRPVRTADADEERADAGRRRDAGIGARDRVATRPALRAPVDVEARLVSSIAPLPAAATGGEDTHGSFTSSSAGPVPSRGSSPSRREAARVRTDTASNGAPTAVSSVDGEERSVSASDRVPRPERRAPVGAVPVPRPSSTLEMMPASELVRDEGDRRATARERAVASHAADGTVRRSASPLPAPLLTPPRPDAADSRGATELDRSTPDGSRRARLRARGSHEASPPSETRAEPPRQRAVSIHIGTIEIRESPPPAPVAAPRPTAARSNGFEEFAALRGYAPWRGR